LQTLNKCPAFIEMARYKVILAYDGTHFSGMQRQRHDRTVQGEVEKALSLIGWPGGSTLIAGRTDAGVHAQGQVIAFDYPWPHGETQLRNALNAVLPADIGVSAVAAVPADFNPRHAASARRYRYQLFWSPTPDPLRERYAWRLRQPVDFDLLVAAAQPLIGVHDFVRFGAPTEPGGPTIRRLDEAQWRAREDLLVFEVQANAFLYHMARRIVRLCVRVGQGRLPLEAVAEYLQGTRPRMIQGLAPPQGLCLMAVYYPDLLGESNDKKNE
jgi:tRNA pseudouridine38-40 synthase